MWGGREGGVHELAHFPTILIYTRETDGEENYLRLPIPTVQNPPQFELHVWPFLPSHLSAAQSTKPYVTVI